MSNKFDKRSRTMGMPLVSESRAKPPVVKPVKKEVKETIAGLIWKAIVRCWKEDKRSIVVAMAIVNLGTAGCGLVWLWYSDESADPPFLGFSWWGEVRAMLLPETTISLGHSAYLLHGALNRKQIAVLVSVLCQTMLTIGSIVFLIFFIFDFVIVHWLVIVATFCYVVIRSFMFYISVVFNQELCNYDEETSGKDSNVRIGH